MQQSADGEDAITFGSSNCFEIQSWIANSTTGETLSNFVGGTLIPANMQRHMLVDGHDTIGEPFLAGPSGVQTYYIQMKTSILAIVLSESLPVNDAGLSVEDEMVQSIAFTSN